MILRGICGRESYSLLKKHSSCFVRSTCMISDIDMAGTGTGKRAKR